MGLVLVEELRPLPLFQGLLPSVWLEDEHLNAGFFIPDCLTASRQIRNRKPGFKATRELNHITLAFTIQFSVPKAEKIHHGQDCVATYSQVYAAVIRAEKNEILDICLSTGSQSTGYSFSCL